MLATSDTFPDALAGAPLAVAKNAPLLLNPSVALDPRVKAEVDRILPAGGDVYLLGGTGALSVTVEETLTNAGYHVTRLAGATRYDTAAAIAELFRFPKLIILATGHDFPDALSAGVPAAALNGPTQAVDPTDPAAFGGGVLLLTDGNQMPPRAQAYVDRWGSAARIMAVGRPAWGAEPGEGEIGGADRYETATNVAQLFSNCCTVPFANATSFGLATGRDFPDALAAASSLARRGQPLLLTEPSQLPPSVSKWLSANASQYTAATIFGGTGVIDDAVATQVENIRPSS